MVLAGESLEKLKIGDRVRVVESENGAKGAEGKIGVYIGMQNRFSIDSDFCIPIRGKRSSCPYGYIIEMEDGDYWNVGNNVILEVISSKTEIKKENEMIIKDFEISKSGNGITVNFVDGTYKKSYALNPDKFDIKKALYICLAKKYSNEYKCDDIEELAKFFAMTKKYIKEVERVYSEYKKEEEIKKIIANRKAKKIRYKANKKAREKEEMIEIQKEAYLRAMREANK